MTIEEIIALLTGFENVHRQENFGYSFFFVGEDRRLPFVTLATQDNEYDKVSHLDRPGVFRLNVGVSKATYQKLFADKGSDTVDYTALDRFMPHPDYAAQFWICILSPGPDSEASLRAFIQEAYDLAKARDTKLSTRQEGSPAY